MDREKSAYFDPVFNPYGVPPPGMPYQAKRMWIILGKLRVHHSDVRLEAPTPEELAAMQAVAERSEDDDIIMPEDPKPDARADSSDEGSDSDSDDDNDIPMPDGPPPPQPRSSKLTGGSLWPAGVLRMFYLYRADKVPLLPPSLPPESMIRLANAPTPQVQLSSSMPSHVPVTYSQGALPLPPTAHALPQRPVSRQVHALPSRPGAANAVLSAAPVLVASPASPASAASKVAAEPLSAEQLAQARAAAVISAAPQVRDLKKEATAFVPQALKRKRAAPTPSAPAPSKKLVQDQSSTGLLPNMLVAARDMRMPPGFSNAQSAAVESRAIDNAQEAYAPTISLHHGVVNGKDDDEASVGPLSPGTAYSNTLPGFDEAEDDDYAGMMPYEGATDVVGPSRPSQSFANTLPGYDEDDDDEEAGPQQDAPMPLRPPDNYTNTLPGYDDDDDYYDNRSAVQTYVEEEEEDE